jgi:prophage regulatory protein
MANDSKNLIDRKERARRVPYSDVQIWRMEREGKFPARISIGPNRVAWLESEIDAWVQAQLDSRDQNL